jgi:hypothetical protein
MHCFFSLQEEGKGTWLEGGGLDVVDRRQLYCFLGPRHCNSSTNESKGGKGHVMGVHNSFALDLQGRGRRDALRSRTSSELFSYFSL